MDDTRAEEERVTECFCPNPADGIDGLFDPQCPIEGHGAKGSCACASGRFSEACEVPGHALRAVDPVGYFVLRWRSDAENGAVNSYIRKTLRECAAELEMAMQAAKEASHV